jgi:hypothetical protein
MRKLCTALVCAVLSMACFAGQVHAQSGNKFYGVTVDQFGNGVGGLSVVINVVDLSSGTAVNLLQDDCITDANGNFSFPGDIPGMGNGQGYIQILVWDGDEVYMPVYTQWGWVAGIDDYDSILVTPFGVDK